MENNKLKEAVEVLCNALKEDPSYYISWQANIAMAFQDVYWDTYDLSKSNGEARITVHKIANEAAKDFLDLLIKQ